LNQASQFQAASASIYYYNKDIGNFQEVGSEKRHRTMLNFNFWESRLFGPFGNNVLSASRGSVLSFQSASSSRFGPSANDSLNVSYVNDRLGEMLLAYSSQSLLVNSDFAATSSQYIRATDYISHPFLIEKMSIEFPIKTGRGWHDDVTTIARIPDGQMSGTGAPVFIDNYDCGGPAITFCLLNQLGDGSRDLILSATLIPSSDNFAGQTNDGSTRAFPYGYLSFGKPAYIVPSASNGTFTGSVTLHLEPQISNGIVSLGFAGSPPGEDSLVRDFPGNNGRDFRNSFAISINPIGRSMRGKGSGRSAFGKEYAMPEADPELSFTATGFSPLYVYNFDKNVNSPYVLMPGDNLLFAFSKYRGCISGSALSSYDFNSPLPNSQHDFWIGTGSVNVTLYGSLIQENKEFHNTLNSNLTTDSVNEMIYGEELLDQWDVSYSEEHSGSYLSSFFTGTIANNRKVLFDSTNVNIEQTFSSRYTSEAITPFWEYSKSSRNAVLTDETELYYDSLIPKFEDILTAETSSLRPLPIKNYTEFGFVNGLIALDTYEQFVTLYASKMWTKSFPFMPLYSQVKRQQSVERLFVRQDDLASSFFYDTNSTLPTNVPVHSSFVIESYQPYDGSSASRLWGDYENVGGAAGNIITGLRKNDLMKILFGFGDLNTVYQYDPGDGNKFYGTTNFAFPRKNKVPPNTSLDGPFWVLGAWQGPLIRGWKYGLINGFPTNTSAVWRRNKFGQFRDMLEQRCFTKFSKNSDILTSPIEVKFIGPNGTNVLPEQTMSSNLSFEATSSLPYFDENVRNREEPISLSSIYSMRFST
jgi:hypothetical protein